MITERAMLAAVHISIWTAVKHDRKVSRDVADQTWGASGRGPLQQATVARRRQAGRTAHARRADPAVLLQDHAALVGRRVSSPAVEFLLRSHGADARVRGRASNRAWRAFFASIRNTSNR